MAVRLDVDVNGQGSINRLNRSLGQTGNSAGRLNRVFQTLGSLDFALNLGRQFVGLARNIAGAADGITQVENQMRAAGVSAEGLAQATEDVRRIANETRQPFEATGQLVARIQRSTAELGLNQQEVLDIAQGFQQSLALSGASTQEAAAASLQFGQALASGRLQGDELRSILENNSFFARSLAENLGVGVGELRTLGAEGALTSEVLANAALNIAPMFNEQFAELAPTLASSFTVFQNGIQFATADILGIVNSGMGLNTILQSAGETLTSIFGPAGNGFTAIFDGIRDAFNGALSGESLASTFNGIYSRFQMVFLDALDFLLTGFNNIDWNAVLNGALEFFINIDWMQVFRTAALAIVGVATSLANAILEINWFEVLANLARAIANIVVGAVSGIGSVISDSISNSRVGRFFGLGGNDAGNQDVQGFASGGDVNGPGSATSDSILARLSNGEFVVNADSASRYRPLLEAINGGGEPSSDTIPRFQTGGIAQQIGSLASQLGFSTQGLQNASERQLEQLNQRLENLNGALQDGNRSQEMSFRAILENSEFIRENTNELSTLDQALNGVSEGLLNDLSGSFTDLLRGRGAGGFQEAGSRFIDGFINSQFDNIFSSLSGSGGPLSFLFRQNGGPVSSGQPYIVGEAGPEVFVPTTGGNVLPNGTSPGGGGGTTNVNYTINAIDSQSFEARLAANPRFLYNLTERGARDSGVRQR